MNELTWHRIDNAMLDYELWVLRKPSSRMDEVLPNTVLYMRHRNGFAQYRFKYALDYVDMPDHLSFAEYQAVALAAYRMGG